MFEIEANEREEKTESNKNKKIEENLRQQPQHTYSNTMNVCIVECCFFLIIIEAQACTIYSMMTMAPERRIHKSSAIAHEQILNLWSKRKIHAHTKSHSSKAVEEAVQLLFSVDVQTIMCVVYIVNEHREANTKKNWLSVHSEWAYTGIKKEGALCMCLCASFLWCHFIRSHFLSVPPVRQLINFSLRNYLLALAIDRYKKWIPSRKEVATKTKLRHITHFAAFSTMWWPADGNALLRFVIIKKLLKKHQAICRHACKHTAQTHLRITQSAH